MPFAVSVGITMRINDVNYSETKTTMNTRIITEMPIVFEKRANIIRYAMNKPQAVPVINFVLFPWADWCGTTNIPENNSQC